MKTPIGKGFSQRLGPHFQNDVSTGLYFEPLKSARRLLLTNELNDRICDKAINDFNDPIQEFEDLDCLPKVFAEKCSLKCTNSGVLRNLWNRTNAPTAKY